ncbi:MAG TPA: M28 family peptidase [Pyrinomonadaceae bacterium]|nr:M28 family peptidase [Pyrinomonadaceae bacterium]
MQRFKLLNLALACALLFNFTAARAQQAGAATAQATAPALSAAALDAANNVTAARLSEHLHIVASDAMEGRDTPSKGLDETAKYIADHLKRFGLKPAGDDGTYFQRITLVRRKIDPARTSAELDKRVFKYGDEFLVGRVGSGTASGALVFVDNGWVVKSKNMNPYKGIDVRDKILIIAGTNLPPGVTRADLAGKVGVDWEDPESYARRNGAKGLVVIPRSRDNERFWRMARAGGERGTFQMERFANAEGEQQQLPGIFASAAMLDALFEGEAVSGADLLKATQAGESRAAFALSPKKHMKFDVAATTDKQMTQNVVGILEGKDATLKGEYIAVGAHYDHVGVGMPVNGDAIFNGADDDGSGTVAILTMAEALSRVPANARPSRSILFVWHAGEEKGLWGSQYFTKFPTVPIKQIAAQLNIDMIGRSKKEGDAKPENKDLSGPNEIYVIGSKMMSTELGNLSERVNRAYLNLNFNYKYDDPADPNRFFFRSDHFNYAQQGIPIIFYFDGVHEDYHRPSDTPDKIDYQKMERVTRTVLVTALELANAPARPRVDKQLPKELTGQ